MKQDYAKETKNRRSQSATFNTHQDALNLNIKKEEIATTTTPLPPWSAPEIATDLELSGKINKTQDPPDQIKETAVTFLEIVEVNNVWVAEGDLMTTMRTVSS